MNNFKNCGYFIKHIHTTLEKEANNDLHDLGLTISQVAILFLLNTSISKEMLLKDIEKNLHLAQSTIAGTVSRLVEKGFVEYFDSSEDRRVKGIGITEKGKNVFSLARSKMIHAEEKLLTNLTETEQTILITLLEKISKNI